MRPRTVYRFADLTLDTGLRRLERAGVPIESGRLTYELLLALVEAAPNVLGHDDLVERVWAGRATSPETITQRVKLLRDALGDDAERPRYVALVRGQGYALIPPVESQPDQRPGGVAKPAAEQAQRRHRKAWAGGMAAVVLATAAALGVYFREIPSEPDTRVAAGEHAPLPNSVAVLPFQNLSPDPANAYFAAGVQETLLAKLTAVDDLNVITRGSVERYADGRTPLAQIAAELRVEALLNGSVQYADGRVRVSAMLVEPVTGRQLWAEAYERDFADIFAVQTDIATEIAAALQAELKPAEIASMAAPPTRSTAAYALYLEAMRDAGRRRLPLEDDRDRLPFLDRAIALDPDFAEAYVAKANIYVWAVAYSEFGSSPEDIERRAEYERLALDSAARAAELDPTLPGPWLVRGVLHLEAWRWDEAEAAFARALELGPNDPDVLMEHAYYRLYSGDFDDARRLAQGRLALDPNSVDSHNAVAFAALISRDVPAALDGYREVVRLAPALWFWHTFVAMAQIDSGDRAGALQSLRTGEQLRGGDDTAIFMAPVAGAYRRLGRIDDARRAFAEFERWAANNVASAGDWVVAYQGIGDADKMFEWLELAVERSARHEPDSHQALIGIVANISGDPVLDEPRFRELRAKLLPLRNRAIVTGAGAPQ